MEKQAKTKEKTKKPPQGKAKTVKGKTPVNEDKFRGNGISFKGKLVGISEVNGPRGDNMCITAIKKLKLHAIKMNKEIGEHKQKIVMNINLKGIQLIDEKTQLVVHEHMINKVSYITHDPEDKRTFGYIVSTPSSTSGHQLFALKTEKPASTVTTTLYELFQVVYKMRQEAQKQKAATPTTPAKNTASSIGNGAAPDAVAYGIYEEPAQCTPPQSKKPPTPHYKIPRSKGVPDPPPPRQDKDTPGEAKKDEDTGSISSEAPTFDAEPIFGGSIIAETGRKNSTLSEAGSVISANVFRSDSMSSSSSGATAQPGEHVRTVVLSPAGDAFSSNNEGTPATAIQQNFSFDAAFPTVSSTSDKPATANDSSNENQPFEAAFPNDSSFGSKGKDKENQSFHATFPDDSDFGSQHFATSEPFKAVFPDESNFGSKVETTAENFASFEDAFPVDSSFNKKTETAPVTYSDNQPFDSSVSAVTSSSSEKQSPSVEVNKNTTDVDSSVFTSASNANISEKETFKVAFPSVSGSCTEVNKTKQVFEDTFSGVSLNNTDNDTSQGFNDDFKPSFSSDIGDLVSTNEKMSKSETVDAIQQVSTSVSITNEIGGQLNQTGDGAVTASTATSVEGEVKSKNEDAHSDQLESVRFQADFSSFQTTAEVISSTADKFETNFDEAFSPVTTLETVKSPAEPATETSAKVNNFAPDSIFDNMQEPTDRSPEKFEALFSSYDPFSASVEDSKNSPSDNTDPFASSQEVVAQQSDGNQFEATFGADSFLSSPFEFKDTTQSNTEKCASELSSNGSKAASSDKSSENFEWQDAFGESSVTAGTSVSAVDDSTSVAESTLSTDPNLVKPTILDHDVSNTDSSPSVIEKNEDNKNESSSTNQDPFCEFKVDFDAFKATADTPGSEDEGSGEIKEGKSEVLKPEQFMNTSDKLVDEETPNSNVENLKVDANIKDKPTQLNFSSKKLEDQPLRPVSPNAPPPLPPRPAVTLPSLPPRPKPNPSTGIIVPDAPVETPAVPPLPKTSQRKPPPALPPRIDLQSRSDQKVDSFAVFDPFGVQSAGTAADSNSAWASDWSSADSVGDFSNETKTENHKSDQFSEDFFTNFDIGDKPASDSTSAPARGTSASPDPFASTDATDPFGSDDLFSQSPFIGSKGTRSGSVKNVFRSGISESFSAVSNNDPFSDISDPFAGQEHVISDPFLDSPEKKDIKLEEDPFSDSFA